MNLQVLEILTEEPSMEIFLREILPKILPKDYQLDENCFIRSHEGKSHLRKSIPIKMRAYPHFGYPVKVLIIHDQDSNDCMRLKKDLESLCNPNLPVVIRIACRELENWYLGDFQAIEAVYPEIKAAKFEKKSKYRDPDIVFGSKELESLIKNFNKSHASREISKNMNISQNRSISFQHFIRGLKKLLDL